MALTVRDIMETMLVTVEPDDSIETVLRTLRDHDLPGVPVVTAGERCVGIITEADLIIAGDPEDLHLPHFFELWGGVVFLDHGQSLISAYLHMSEVSCKVGDMLMQGPQIGRVGAAGAAGVASKR